MTFHGEELPYIFGVPLNGPMGPFDYEYSEHEQLLCETMISFWVNFAYAGYAFIFYFLLMVNTSRF